MKMFKAISFNPSSCKLGDAPSGLHKKWTFSCLGDLMILKRSNLTMSIFPNETKSCEAETFGERALFMVKPFCP